MHCFRLNRPYIIILFSLIGFLSCSQKKEIFETESLSDYMPLQVGKSITYRLDSTVFVLSGTVIETHKYQVRHTVLQEMENSNGSKTIIVQRLINNEAATGPWLNNGIYQIVLFENKVEVINNNLRVVVLQTPLKQGFSWKGNSQLPFAPYMQLYDMAAGREMNDWDFSYTNFGNVSEKDQQYQNVWTVEHHNETLNIPPTPNTSYGSKEVSSEKYAKGIGLVYKDFQLYEYQGANSQNPSAHYTGFGITMWMIAHD